MRTNHCLKAVGWALATCAFACASGALDPQMAAAQSVRLRWYDSPIDGRSQPYAIVPPRNGDGGPYGLILALHGHDGGPGGYCALTLGGEVPPADMVIVCPYGYGNTAFRHIGEEDVFEAISRVVDEFPLDPRRIYVTGGSDGGVAAYEMALHHPDLFAAAMPLAAYGGQTFFPSIGREGHRSWEKPVIALHDMTKWAENAAQIPFRIVNGARDFWSPLPEETVAAHLEKLGYSVDNVVHGDLAHDTWTRTYRGGAGIAWFRDKVAADPPARVVFTTADPRYRTAYWVSGLELEAPIEKFARVEAVADAAKATVAVTTKSLLALRISPPVSVLGAADAMIKVTIDGREFEPVPASELAAGVYYHRDEGAGRAWREGPLPVPVAAAGLRIVTKQSGLAGPLTDFRSKPVIFVYGTVGDPRQAAALREIAEEERRHWTKGIRVDYPVVPDHAVTDADRASRTLVLIGGGNMNRVASDVESRTAIRVLKDGAAVEVGKELYVGPSTGYRFIHPSLWSADQYVVVVGGTDLDGVRLASGLPELQPDFVIAGPASRSPDERRGMVLGKNRSVIAAGFFDRLWRLPVSLRGLPATPVEAPVSVEPATPSAPAPAEPAAPPAPAPAEPAAPPAPAPAEPATPVETPATVEPEAPVATPAPTTDPKVAPAPAPDNREADEEQAWPEAPPIE